MAMAVPRRSSAVLKLRLIPESIPSLCSIYFMSFSFLSSFHIMSPAVSLLSLILMLSNVLLLLLISDAFRFGVPELLETVAALVLGLGLGLETVAA